ncbi:NADH-quinone oxidoreductase subunit K [Thiohalorhabdus sp.]|uniref:NADH-quinone oxidoreductase subunit K n=1 Tax=Thiohalorhabdus sp. TaxID=3094134 RepID=UPI002FC35A4B
MTAVIYLGLGLFLAVLGSIATFLHRDVLRRIVALNVAGTGVFLALAAGAGRGGADPVAHALVLTGIVVAVAITGVALVLLARLAEKDGEGDP